MNYAESDEEEDFNLPHNAFHSPLISPSRPTHTRSGSPQESEQELVYPTLSDNVDADLEAAKVKLESSILYRYDRSKEELVEDVVVGHVAEAALNSSVQGEANMPDDDNVEVDFEVENGVDGAKALEHTRTLKIEYDPTEVEFWFVQLENEMYTCEVKSQWLKRCVLVKNLPPKVQADVKSLLVLKKSEATADLYQKIKKEILRIHAPVKQDTYKKALSRVLVGLPSQLGQQLVNDICDKSVKLTGCCCAKAVYTLWCLQLPIHVRSLVADKEFNATTYNEVFQAADKVFLSTKTTEISAGVAAIAAPPATEEGAAGTEVAALRRGGGGNNNRNRGSNRGNRRGGNRSNSSRPTATADKPRGPRHSSNPSEKCCDNHYKWSSDAWFCLEPLTCPMVNKCSAKPATSAKK